MPDDSVSRSDPRALLQHADAVVASAESLLAVARARVLDRVVQGDAVAPERLDSEQHVLHGLAWLATYVRTLGELRDFATFVSQKSQLTDLECELTLIGLSEYFAQCLHGVAMSQTEFIRPADFGIEPGSIESLITAEARHILLHGNTAERRARAYALIEEAPAEGVLTTDMCDDELAAMRAEIARFCQREVAPHAHRWHLDNAYIPLDVVTRLADLGVFGLTIPEEYGGLGLSKVAMCLVTEELARGYIGVGSLGTRSEIAAELILCGGTEAQKAQYLPRIASGEVLTTAVFTEPDAGSDLASLRTRAIRHADGYRIQGAKTWITHPVRADLMTLLARTGASDSGYRGLSMFLIEKPRGTDKNPFPLAGMSGSEIEVLGYRGMKEFDIAFEGLEIPAEALLGETEGQGFKQLMQTFESARIQTAARAVGVAQNALDVARRYATDRRQFGKQLGRFPRVADKIVMMAVEVHCARQITVFAARRKDAGERCDIEAGMAKLLAARVAWAAADNALQIHGGNGFALEFPVSRLLCDARILSIFEGAAEIQAHVIGRRLLEA
jgi:(2S)-methylsuccinyl-CoA dehydrogenase